MIDAEAFRQLTDSALELILVFREDGNIIYANKMAKEVLDYENGVENSSITEVFPRSFSKEHEHGKLECKITLENKSQSLMAYRGNRTCFAVEAKIYPFPDRDGLYICLANDSTKQNYFEKKANQAGQQAESAEQVKTQFVANVTHELRTPVNGILGNTQELIRIETEPNKQRLLGLIERGCNDMHNIINNILDFSKLEAGKFTLETRPFSFRKMMDYVKSNHINKITEKGLQFFMTISPEIPETIIGDELRIVQVLNNLLSNATKFTVTGRITLEVVMTAKVGNRIELFFMVIDTGIGIGREDQDKLFKSFSQAEASTTRKYGGTGLGLFISKQLVELMGGNIHVESEKNRGTMFSFHIWVETETKAGEEASEKKTLFDVKIPTLADMEPLEEIWEYGTPRNMEEIKKKMNKLILSVEMQNWEKAEMFMDTLKQLTAEAPGPVRSAALRLKMAVQKADYEKTTKAFEVFQDSIQQ